MKVVDKCILMLTLFLLLKRAHFLTFFLNIGTENKFGGEDVNPSLYLAPCIIYANQAL